MQKLGLSKEQVEAVKKEETVRKSLDREIMLESPERSRSKERKSPNVLRGGRHFSLASKQSDKIVHKFYKTLTEQAQESQLSDQFPHLVSKVILQKPRNITPSNLLDKDGRDKAKSHLVIKEHVRTVT